MEIKVDPMQQTVAATDDETDAKYGRRFQIYADEFSGRRGTAGAPFTHDGRHYDAGEKTWQAYGCA